MGWAEDGSWEQSGAAVRAHCCAVVPYCAVICLILLYNIVPYYAILCHIAVPHHSDSLPVPSCNESAH